MRRAAAATALLALGVGLALTGPSEAAPAKPGFTSVLLKGSSGSAEPRASISDKGVHWITTNAKNGEEVVYRSTDGIAWKQVTTPGGQSSPTIDVDVVTMPSGRVLTSELDFAGINFITHVSDDQGKTWKQSTGQTFADTDRQWFAVGPPLPGATKPRVYLLFHNLLSGLAQHNMFVSTSVDGGESFGPPIPVALPPQQDYLDLQCADSGGPSNIFVNPRNGRVSVVFGTRSSPLGGCTAQPVELNIVAANRVWVVTADAKDTATPGAWKPSLAVDDTASGKITGMQLAPGAVDDAGNYYVAYPESIRPYPDYSGGPIKVVDSRDLVTWSKPLTIAPAAGAGNILPHIVAGEAGKIDVAWYHGETGGQWYSYSAQVLDALSPAPHVVTTKLSDVQVEKGTATKLMGACLSGPTATLNGFACGRSADVYGVALDPCGRLLVSWPAQAGLPSDGTYSSQQVTGPRVRSAVCAQAVKQPSVVTPPRTPITKPANSGGGKLAATGLSARFAGLAVAALLAAAALRRRRVGTLSA
ncbi:MAG: hypothetical protein JWN31_427 [Frankiales bacterium]|nr:hypothetical protein [Frankiales bacterium]